MQYLQYPQSIVLAHASLAAGVKFTSDDRDAEVMCIKHCIRRSSRAVLSI